MIMKKNVASFQVQKYICLFPDISVYSKQVWLGYKTEHCFHCLENWFKLEMVSELTSKQNHSWSIEAYNDAHWSTEECICLLKITPPFSATAAPPRCSTTGHGTERSRCIDNYVSLSYRSAERKRLTANWESETCSRSSPLVSCTNRAFEEAAAI